MKDPMKVGKPGVNYYALLGVPSTASPEEITKAFRKKILQVHLDKMAPEDDTELCYLTIEAHRILSDKALRQKYDVERSSSKDYKAQEEKFIPAGYICYDVGHQQMSRQLLDSITSWTSEYDKCASELSDNYFNCFSQIMAQVAGDNENDDDVKIQSKLQQNIHYYCPVCDKSYVTETHHWDAIINPYRAMFFSDQQGIAALNAYFQGLIGQSMFEWELRYLPTRLLGIWGSSEWSMIPKLHQQTVNILKQCDSEKVISELESMLECSSSKANNASFTSAQNAFLRRSLIQNLIWVLENRDQTVEQMMSRMNELIMQDDIQEIMCLGMAMRNVLKFQSSEWQQLIQDALSQEQFELAMLWTMLAVESGAKSKGDWFQLGMTIRGMGDAVLAHFCFLLAGYDSENAWEELADLFTQNGAHHASIEYHLNRGNLFQLLNKSRALKKTDPDSAALYSGIFYATRVKGLLQTLRKRPRQCFSDNTASEAYNAEMEELIEIMQDLGGNPLEGFRIIVSTWPDVFEESPGYWIHRATIQYLRTGRVNLKSQKLILAAVHFLPEDEAFEEICQIAKEASQLTRSMLERAQETNDFEMLTDVLLHLNKRTLSTAEKYLEEIRPPPPETTPKGEKIDGEEGETLEEECTPPPQPTAPEPSHKSAIFLLLCGTVNKVNERWLDAMKDYQNALLNAPEVLHRLLPCVSKLVQDIQFHEAVVAQVHQEIQDLQESLRKREYPNVDEFSSDKRRSLILTDVAPIMDYGYKDSVSKIQPDPDKMPPPPPPDEEPMDAPPPPPANTPMVTLDRNQEAIQSGQQDGQMDQLSAALAYVDLLKALPLPMHPGPIVMAASHFLRAMDDNAKPEEIGKLYAYRNAIMMMAENLLRVDKKLQHTIHHGLTHKHMLSILLSAHEKLSKALAKKNDNNNDATEKEDESSSFTLPTPSSPDEPVTSKVNDDHEAQENNKNSNCKSNKKDLIRKTEANVISKLFQNVVNFPKVEPLASIPTLNCSDLVYVETLGNSFLSQFCADKLNQKHDSPLIPKHLHAYTHFVEVWKGRSNFSNFESSRLKAMEELLAIKGWNLGDVERKMRWPFIPLRPDGFSPHTECLLQLRDPLRSYRTIDGFQINYETGSVELLMSRDTLYPADTLFDLYDIQDVVSLSKAGLDRLVFSLETPDFGGLSSHPFKEAKFTIAGQNSKGHGQHHKIISQIPEFVMATLSRVSMLLCYLASGLEMCSETPFWMRRTDEGLLARLDEHLQHLARPITWRRAERRENNEKSPFESETMGKFWLNMIEVFEEIEEEDEGQHEHDDDPLPVVPSRQLTYRVGQMRTEIRPNTLVMTLDPKRGKQRLSPEGEFCRDLTRHFQEFSRAFPELQRLEELVKISIVCSKLKQVLKENKALIQEFHLKNNQSSSRTGHNNSKLKAVHRVCSVIERFLTLQNPEREENNSCNWFPATFCHNMDPDVYDVSAALELDPVVTYGPVPASNRPIKVPLEKIISLGGQAVDFDGETDGVMPEGRVEKMETINRQVESDDDDDSEEEDEEEDEEYEEEEEEEEEEKVEQDEACVCDGIHESDAASVNRTLTAVPEESEDEEESEEEEISEDDDYETSFASVKGNEGEISESEQQKSILEEEELLSSEEEEDDDDDAVADGTENSESDRGSQCKEIDADLSENEEDVAAFEEDEPLVESESFTEEESREESSAQVDDHEVEEEEDDVPTLTIIIKRSSIISQTEDDGFDTIDEHNEIKQHGSENKGNDGMDESECSDKDAESAPSITPSDEASRESVSEAEKDKDADLMDDDSQEEAQDELKHARNDLSENESEEPDEAGFYSEEESENEEVVEDEVISPFEEETAELEDSEIEDGKVSTSIGETGEKVDEVEHETESESCRNTESEAVSDTADSEEENEDEREEDQEINSALSPNNKKSLSIEGKSVVKLRKVNVEIATPGQNQTKRAFLTRRGRLMVKLEQEKVMENIVNDSLEKSETDSEDGELIITNK